MQKDLPFTYKPFETPNSVEEALFGVLKGLIEEASPDHPYAVMLSGGSTPAGLYRRVAESGIRAGEGLYLLVSDERLVPLDSPDANRTMIAPMADAIGLPEERLIMVEHELSADAAAERYHQALTEINARGVSRSTALLGVGTDGHTASLFDLEAVTEPHTTLAEGVAEHAGFERVTATPEEILSYRRLIFFAAGEKKRAIIEAIAETAENYPAAVLAGRHGNAELWTDQRIAELRPGSPGSGSRPNPPAGSHGYDGGES